MSTREANVFARLKERVMRPGDRMDRIENGLAAGWPDVNYCFVGREGWIELKAPDAPVNEATPLFGSNHPLSIDQANWFLNQARAKGRAFLFIGTQRYLLLISGKLCTEPGRINTATLAVLLSMAAWSTPVPVISGAVWSKLRGTLCD